MRFNPLKPNAPNRPVTPIRRLPDTVPAPAQVSRLPVLKENEEHDGFEIHFLDGKPSDEILAQFRATKEGPAAQRWRFHFGGKFWYAKRNPLNRVFALALCQGHTPLPADEVGVAHVGAGLAKIFGLDKLPPNCVVIHPDEPTEPPPSDPIENQKSEIENNIVPVEFSPPSIEMAAPIVRTPPRALTGGAPSWRTRLAGRNPNL